jgi:nucleotide-binding universal stress UspA family protein
MFKSVVLALDGSESSDRALQFATELAGEHKSSVLVVHVRELAVGRAGGPAHVNEDELQAKIESQVKALGDAGVDAKLEVHSTHVGAPAHVIAEAAQRVGADAIVTGTRGHTIVAGMLLGSVPLRLLHVAHCPVVVVPLRT